MPGGANWSVGSLVVVSTQLRNTHSLFAASNDLRPRCRPCYSISSPFDGCKACLSILSPHGLSHRYACTLHSYWVSTDRRCRPSSAPHGIPPCSFFVSYDHLADASRLRKTR